MEKAKFRRCFGGVVLLLGPKGEVVRHLTQAFYSI